MYVKVSERRTQAERREATRTALIDAGRRLFAERGFDAVSAEEVVAAAGVTRGALYHHFDGKRGLFAAIFERIEDELVANFDFSDLENDDPLSVLIEAVDQFLDLSLEADVQRIGLIDGPAVLGWEEWHRIEADHGLGLIEGALNAAAEAGVLRDVPIPEVALMLLGAMIEAALQLARAEDQAVAKERTGAALRALLEGLRA